MQHVFGYAIGSLGRSTIDESSLLLIGLLALIVVLPFLLRWIMAAIIGAGTDAARNAIAANKNKQLAAQGLDTGLLIARYVGSNALPPELADIAERVAKHQISEEDARAHIIAKGRELGLYDTDGDGNSWAKNRTVDCPQCGNTVPAGVKFCNKCGTPIPEEAPALAVPLSPGSEEVAVADSEDVSGAPVEQARQVGKVEPPQEAGSGDASDAPVSVACPHCGQALLDGAKFCGFCGGPVPVQPAACPSCGASIIEGAKFCGVCGAPVS